MPRRRGRSPLTSLRLWSPTDRQCCPMRSPQRAVAAPRRTARRRPRGQRPSKRERRNQDGPWTPKSSLSHFGRRSLEGLLLQPPQLQPPQPRRTARTARSWETLCRGRRLPTLPSTLFSIATAAAAAVARSQRVSLSRRRALGTLHSSHPRPPYSKNSATSLGSQSPRGVSPISRSPAWSLARPKLIGESQKREGGGLSHTKYSPPAYVACRGSYT